MSDPFAKWKNPGSDTYNGVAMFADLTGLSSDEIMWTQKRMKELFNHGIDKEDVKKIVAEESKGKPWIR